MKKQPAYDDKIDNLFMSLLYDSVLRAVSAGMFLKFSVADVDR